LDQAFFSFTQCSTECSSYDLLGAIQTLRRLSSIHWNVTHVKGHQDRNHATLLLSRLEALNIEVDAATKGYLPIAMASPRHYLIENEQWSIW
jgi:hypothetical protein